MKRYAVALAVVLTFACNLNINKSTDAPNNVVITLPAASPIPAPSTSPTPSASPGTSSDVASLAVFSYGFECPAGTPEPSHAAGVLPAPCTGVLITATPKRADGTDATSHGRALTWTVNGIPSTDFAIVDAGIVTAAPGPVELTFNRTLRVKNPRALGSVVVVATLVAPDSRTHTGGKVVTIQ